MKDYWKGGNMLYPLPAVMISCGDMANSNVFTVAWCGNCNTNPPMVYISVRKERFSYDILKQNKEFVINLVNEELVTHAAVPRAAPSSASTRRSESPRRVPG